MKKHGNNPPIYVQSINYCINYRLTDIEMDCPCLLGRTLYGLVQSPESQLFLFVCPSGRLPFWLSCSTLPLCLCTHLFSNHPDPQSPALLKTLHFISLAPPWAPSSVGQGSGHPSAQTGGTARLLYFGMCCVLTSPGVLCLSLCLSLTVRTQSTATAGGGHVQAFRQSIGAPLS